MKDQIIVARNTGEVFEAVPLFRPQYSESLGKLDGYSISLFKNVPIAFVVVHPELKRPMLMNAEFVCDNFDFVGEL